MNMSSSKSRLKFNEDALRNSSVYGEYLRGIENLRQLVTTLEQELVVIEKEFYQIEPNSLLMNGNYDERAASYMQNISNMLLEAVQVSRDNRFDSVHSETRIINLIERLRRLASRVTVSLDTRVPDTIAEESEDPQATTAALQLISKLTDFWESQKYAVERIQSITDKYEKQVLSKLQSNCLSFANAFGVKDQKTIDSYTETVLQFIDKIQGEMQGIRMLCSSFTRGVRTQSCRDTIRINMLLRKCDLKSYHVLLLTPNLTDKFETLLRYAREWLDREETYIFELRRTIRETKNLAAKTESALVTEKEKQRKIMQAMKNAFLLCRSYKKQVEEVETELTKLKAEADEIKSEKEAKKLDHDKKQEHIEFLEINLGKTKMNVHIKMRKERLLKQLQHLEDSISQLEVEIMRVQNLMDSKSAEKYSMAGRAEENERELSKLRREFSQFTLKVNNLQGELVRINDQLSAMQAIESFKTSADVVDNFFDRPVSVKLSPSLKRRIAQKRQLARPLPRSKSRSTSDLVADN